MTALFDIARAIPDHTVRIADVAPELGIDPLQLRVFERYFGLRQVRTAPGKTLTDVLVEAARGLPLLSGNEHRIRYVIGARTLATVAPLETNPLHEVAARLGLDHAVVFTLTQHACASALLAVDMAGRLLGEDPDPDSLALVLTGEKAFSPESQVIPGITVMGEGTAACLVAARRGSDRQLSYATRTLGQYHSVPLPDELAAPYTQDYVVTLVDTIKQALAMSNTPLDDLALILPHNVNRVSWKRTCKELDYPMAKVYLDNVPLYGHCFGADSFINYLDARAAGQIKPGDRYLMASVGLGSTFSAMVLEHESGTDDAR